VNKKQAAKLALIATTAASLAPVVLPYIPVAHHGLFGSLLAALAILGGGVMKSPLDPKQPKNTTIFPPSSSQK